MVEAIAPVGDRPVGLAFSGQVDGPGVAVPSAREGGHVGALGDEIVDSEGEQGLDADRIGARLVERGAVHRHRRRHAQFLEGAGGDPAHDDDEHQHSQQGGAAFGIWHDWLQRSAPARKSWRVVPLPLTAITISTARGNREGSVGSQRSRHSPRGSR